MHIGSAWGICFEITGKNIVFNRKTVSGIKYSEPSTTLSGLLHDKHYTVVNFFHAPDLYLA